LVCFSAFNICWMDCSECSW